MQWRLIKKEIIITVEDLNTIYYRNCRIIKKDRRIKVV